MNVLDLFSGIGGFSLGLERAGMRTVAFCEIEPYCRAVLKKHWPHVPCYEDVRAITSERLRADGIAPEVIAGGFPCQDLSTVGKQVGISGARSGLWGDFARLIGEVRPKYAIVENVPNLLVGERGAWFGRVLGDLAEIGFDAQWHCIPASAIGAPHIRDRVWIVAHPNAAEDHSKTITKILAEYTYAGGDSCAGWRAPLPPISRMGDGIPGEMDELAALGNAVVPQVVEIIGKAIMQAEGLSR